MSRTRKDRGRRGYNVGKKTKEEARGKRRTMKQDPRYKDLTDPKSLKRLSADRWNHD